MNDQVSGMTKFVRNVTTVPELTVNIQKCNLYKIQYHTNSLEPFRKSYKVAYYKVYMGDKFENLTPPRPRPDWMNQQFTPVICRFLLQLKQKIMNFVILPVEVHGQWSRWSPDPVDHCSCKGKVRQYRKCANPPPSCGGSYCSGPCARYVDCDECRCNNGGCQQICDETDEGYSCSCLEGYRSSGKSCIGT